MDTFEEGSDASLDNSNDGQPSTVATTDEIKERIASGFYKTTNAKVGRSCVWKIFKFIEDETGEPVKNLVMCSVCKNIYRFYQTTSNLVKHRCFKNYKNCSQTKEIKFEAPAHVRKDCAVICIDWIVNNCRPYAITADAGLKQFAEFLISIGADYGKSVDLEKLLPNSANISANVQALYAYHKNELQKELEEIKDVGFGLTCAMWTDNLLEQSYVSATIHYIINGELFARVLAVKLLHQKDLTGFHLRSTVQAMLEDLNLELNNCQIVTEHETKMIAAFGTDSQLFCIADLINNCVRQSIEEVPEIECLWQQCVKLAQHFEKTGHSSAIANTGFSSSMWQNIFSLLKSVQQNWQEISKIAKTRTEMNLIQGLNKTLLADVTALLEHFDSVNKKLQQRELPTINILYVHVHHLKRICMANDDDLDIIQKFKESLTCHLFAQVYANMHMIHKVALFLFPPTNKLLQFSNDEKFKIKEHCKCFLSFVEVKIEKVEKKVTQNSSSTIMYDAFADFVESSETTTVEQNLANEILMYENMKVTLDADFDVLAWWHQRKFELPLLYKLSRYILSCPASCEFSNSILSKARSLITENSEHPETINQIMFLHNNVSKDNICNILKEHNEFD